MTNFAALIPKTYSSLTDDGDKNKKAKQTKKCVLKRKLKFKEYKFFLKATQLENQINHTKNNKLDVDSLKGNYKVFIRNNRLIPKSQQRFRTMKQYIH